MLEGVQMDVHDSYGVIVTPRLEAPPDLYVRAFPCAIILEAFVRG